MRSFLILLLPLLFSYQISAQDAEKRDENFSIQLFTGADFYLPQIEGDRLKPLARPTLGFALERKTKSPFSYALGIQYSQRAALYTPAIRLEERALEFMIGPRFQAGDFSFFINGIYSSATRSFEKRTESNFFVPTPDLDNSSSIRVQLGAEVSLMPKLGFFVNRMIVLDENGSYINQFGLRYSIGPRNKPSGRAVRRSTAASQINELKDGVLLVRLQNPIASIQALEEKGQQNKASMLEHRISEQNGLLMGAFASDYDFSKVYFFYSQHSDSVRKGNFNGILYDQYFKQIKETGFIDSSKVFTAEFGEMSHDSLKYFDHLDHEGGRGAFTNKTRSYYYSGASIHSFDAIVISDQDFNQLNKPFPYFSRWAMPGIQERPEQAVFFAPFVLFWGDNVGVSVKRLNRKLHEFYIKHAD